MSNINLNNAAIYFTATKNGQTVHETFSDNTEFCDSVVAAKFITNWLDNVDPITREVFVSEFVKRYVEHNNDKENVENEHPLEQDPKVVENRNNNIAKELYEMYKNDFKNQERNCNKYSTTKEFFDGYADGVRDSKASAADEILREMTRLLSAKNEQREPQSLLDIAALGLSTLLGISCKELK